MEQIGPNEIEQDSTQQDKRKIIFMTVMKLKKSHINSL